MQTRQMVIRIGLFSFVLFLGIVTALLVGETKGFALADLSSMPVTAMTRATVGDTLYAALDGENQGVYRSDDTGYSWELISHVPDMEITALAVNPTAKHVLYAAANNSSMETDMLYYSDSGGADWQQTSLTVPEITVLTASPNHPGLVYVGTDGHGLYRYWQSQDEVEHIGAYSVPDLYVKDVIVSPDNLVYAVTTDGLLVIDGVAWQKMAQLPDGVVSMAVDPEEPNTLYVGTVGYGAQRSTDGGQSWQPINEGLGWQPGIILRASAITVDKENPEHLATAAAYSVGSQFAGHAIYESFDSGQHWAKVTDTDSLVNRLTIKSGGIYAATDHGLVRYGQPAEVAPTESSSWLQLQNLSNGQASILSLTIILAGLVLVGRTEWLFKRSKVANVINSETLAYYRQRMSK